MDIIKNLRRQFVMISMCSIFVVLFIIVGALNIVSYSRMTNRADDLLQMLSENDADFPKGMFDIDMFHEGKPIIDKDVMEKPGMSPEDRNQFNREGMTAETPYETRFFSVRFDNQGNFISVDTGKVAAIEEKDAKEYALAVVKSSKSSGFYKNYRYRYVQKENEQLVIFIDRERELSAFRTLLISSVAVSILGLLAVFLLVLIFSNKVFKPVSDSYQKQKRFITDASHELKTPLAIIRANTDILELELESSDNKWIKSIKNQIERLTRLTEQLVLLSRMDEGSEKKVFSEFSLADAVDETAKEYVNVALARDKHININIENDVCTYKGDEKKIRQMIGLLLDNAIKYSDDNGQIILTLSKKGKKYNISLWNTAENIPEGNLNILFERFYRIDSSRNSENGGTGIGLSVVKAIAELHHGKVGAYSSDGKSVTFEIIL